MASYVVPSVLVQQEFTPSIASVLRPLRACIVGPRYSLIRYDQTTEKASGYLGLYDYLVDTEYDWPNKSAGDIVDQDYTRVFMDDALLRYFYDPRGGGYSEIRAIAGYKNRIKAPNIVWKTANGYDRHSALYDRDVTAGDVVKIEATIDGVVVFQETTVKSFAAEVVDDVIDAAVPDSGNQADATDVCTAAQSSGSVNSVVCVPDCSDYNGYPSGRISETYTLEVIQGSVGGDAATARISVVSGDGNDNQASVTPSAFGVATSIGTRGLEVVFDNAEESSPGDDWTEGADPDDFIVGQTWVVNTTQDYIAADSTSGGDYSGPSDATYIVEVTRGGRFTDANGPQITVTTTTGIDMSGPHDVTGLGIPISLGAYGVTIQFSGAGVLGLCYGDKFYIDVEAESEGAIRTLVLSNNIVDSLRVSDDISSSSPGADLSGPDLSIWLYIRKDIEVSENRTSTPPLQNWETSSAKITINDGVEAYDSTWTNSGALMALPVEYGKIYVTCRYLVTSNCNELNSTDTISGVEDDLGAVTADNPLALGVYKALENSGAESVYWIAICTDDLSGYTSALEVLENTQMVWGLVPLSYLKTVKDAFKAHVLSMSVAARGRWRVVFIANELDFESAVMTADSSGDPLLATLEEDPAASGEYTYLTSPGADFVTNGVAANDTVRYHYTTDGFGTEAYSTYVVDQVVSEDVVKLVVGDSSETSIAKKFTVYHTNTTGELAAQVAAHSGLFGHRRVSHVFPDNPGNAGETMESYFLAAAIAGLKSSVLPHQGLTNMTVSGFDDMSRTTEFFTASELNTIAEGGTLIVTQDEQTGNIYVRHQLTTDMTDVNSRELSVTATMDAASYVYLDRMETYIGRSNITETTMNILRTEIDAAGEYLMSIDTTLAGPLIENAEIQKLEQSSAALDRVECEVRLDLPYPLNYLEITLIA